MVSSNQNGLLGLFPRRQYQLWYEEKKKTFSKKKELLQEFRIYSFDVFLCNFLPKLMTLVFSLLLLT